MKLYQHFVGILMLFLLLPSLYAQDNVTDQGIIKIRKKNNEKAKHPVYIGIHFGKSGCREAFNRRSQISDQIRIADNYFTSSNPDFQQSTAGRTYSFGNSKDIMPSSPLLPRQYQVGVYATLPLNKYLALVPDASLCTGYYFSSTTHREGSIISTSETVEYATSTKFQNTQVQLMLQLEGHITIRRSTPYVRVGMGKLINVRSRKITDVDLLNAPEEFINEMQKNGYETQNSVEDITTRPSSWGVVINPGCRFKISDRFNATLDLQFVQSMQGYLADIKIPNYPAIGYSYGITNLSMGLEMKLNR